MGEPRLGEGGVCNTDETCMQLADRNHARARRRQWLVARPRVQLAHRRSLVQMGEPRLGESAVSNTEETYTQLVDQNHARERRLEWLVAARPASRSEVSSRNGQAAVRRRRCLQH